MQKTYSLKADARTTGTKSAVKDRSAGKLPAVIYGHKQDPIAVSVDAHDFVEAIHHGHRLFDLEIGNKKDTVMIKDVQYDYLGKSIIHIDLIRVDISEKVKVDIPIVIKGTAKGAAEGGIVSEQTGSLEIECTVTEIPESIEVNVKDLGVDDVLYAKDIVLPEGFKLITDGEVVVATCSLPAAEVSEAAEAGAEAPAQPELIRERKPAEEEK